MTTLHVPRRLWIVPLLLPALAGGWAQAMGGPGPGDARREGLERRYREIDRKYQQSQQGQVSLDDLRAEIGIVIDSLAAARMDSLAADASGMLCELHWRENDLATAEAVIRRAVSIARRGGLREMEADRLLDLGVLEGLQGHYEQAVAAFAELAVLYGELGNRSSESVCWGNIAYSYLLLGRIPEALAANAAALPLARGGGRSHNVSSALSTRSQLLRRTGRLSESVAYADSSARAAREGNWILPLGTALAAKADALHDLARFEEALGVLDEAIEARTRSGHEVYLPSVIQSKGQVLLRLERPVACLALMDEWIPRLERQNDPTNLFSTLTLRGQALLELERFAEAETVLTAALRRFESYRGLQREEESEAGIYLRGGEVYAALARCQLEGGRTAAAWETTERGRAAVLRRLLEADSASAPAGREPPRVADLRALQRFLGEARAVLVQTNDPRLNPLVAFVVTADTLQARELGPLDPLLADARTAADLIASEAEAAAVEPILRRLAQRIAAPLAPLLPPGAERLIVIPPSALSGFPFELLAAEEGGGPTVTLGDRYAVSYVPAASVLLDLAEVRREPGREVVVLADPRWDAADLEPAGIPSQIRALRRTPLPHARAEAAGVAGRSGTVWLGTEATEEQARSRRAREASVLHFATHAVVTPLAPDRSSLLLAASSDSPEDGMLTAAEVRTLALEADLVTLSACATSVGLPVVGEGSYGLPRAFLVAGARSVVASSWKVEDRAASLFMKHFYDALRRGHPRDVSLQRARRAMERAGLPLRDRAAFVLLGIGHEPVAGLARGATGATWIAFLGAAVVAAVIGMAAARVRSRRRPPPAGR
jgi:CHAT domain-containing protein